MEKSYPLRGPQVRVFWYARGWQAWTSTKIKKLANLINFADFNNSQLFSHFNCSQNQLVTHPLVNSFLQKLTTSHQHHHHTTNKFNDVFKTNDKNSPINYLSPLSGNEIEWNGWRLHLWRISISFFFVCLWINSFFRVILDDFSAREP